MHAASGVALVFALHVFAFRLDDVQLAAVRSRGGVVFYVLAMIVIVAIARAYRRWQVEIALEFNAPAPEAPAVLNLSQATG